MKSLATGLHHASAVAIEGKAILILGASGSGKSTLTLALMRLGAALIGDDQVKLIAENSGITVKTAPNLHGHIELRGVGILKAPHLECAPLCLVVDLETAPETRLPEPRSLEIEGVNLPCLLGKGVINLDMGLYLMMKYGRAA